MLILEGPKATVTALAFSPDGGELAVGTRGGGVAVTDIYGGKFRTVEAEFGFDHGILNAPAIQAMAYDPTYSVLIAGNGVGWRGWRKHEEPRPAASSAEPTQITGIAFLNESTLVLGSGNRIKSQPGHLELCTYPSGKTTRAVLPRAGRRAGGSGPRRIARRCLVEREPPTEHLEHAHA